AAHKAGGGGRRRRSLSFERPDRCDHDRRQVTRRGSGDRPCGSADAVLGGMPAAYQWGIFPVAAASPFVRLALLRTGLTMRYLGRGTSALDMESGRLVVAGLCRGGDTIAGQRAR